MTDIPYKLNFAVLRAIVRANTFVIVSYFLQEGAYQIFYGTLLKTPE
ncbi:hypothetical protein QUA04_11860 [Microcoleus sp. S13_C5]